jgi:hypothetical protein
MKTKFLIGGVVISLLLGWMQTAMAAGPPAMTITSGETRAGEAVTLTVGIKQNAGIAACLLYLYYDTSVFDVDPSSDLAAGGDFGSTGGLIGNTIAAAKANGRYDGAEDKDGVLVLWYNGSGQNTTGDGTVLTVTLHTRADAPEGVYEVELDYSKDDTCDEAGQALSLQTASGTVTVTGEDGVPGHVDTAKPNVSDGQNKDQPGEDQTADESAEPLTPDQDAPAESGSDSTAPQPADGGGSATDQTELTGITTGTDSETSAEVTAPITYSDVSGHWAEKYIERATELGLVNGMNGLYCPDDDMTRAQLVTILWRAMGSQTPTGPASFTDLDPEQPWYLDAVAWAEENGVVNGVGGGRFDPDANVTREQLMTILHRLSGKPSGLEMLLSGIYDQQFEDSGAVSDWAKAAVYWSIYKEIICGEASASVGQALAPTAAANRAQIAVMMVRYLEQQ